MSEGKQTAARTEIASRNVLLLIDKQHGVMAAQLPHLECAGEVPDCNVAAVAAEQRIYRAGVGAAGGHPGQAQYFRSVSTAPDRANTFPIRTGVMFEAVIEINVSVIHAPARPLAVH